MLVSERAKFLANIVSSGVILANLLISSSSTLKDFAVLHMSSSWLHAVAFICGFALGTTLERALAIFYGVCSMSLIAVLIFGGVVTSAALLSNTPIFDVVLLFVFQRSFPSFISICVLGCVGAFLSSLFKPLFGRL